MSFVPFEMERWQSTYENEVEYNLSESGIHPFSVAEFLELVGRPFPELGSLELGYGHTAGTPELRRAIAGFYGADPENVLVTVGSSEGNFISCWTLIQPGDRVVVMTPNYLQTLGLAKNLGAEVVPLPLAMEGDWQLDPDRIRDTITSDTKVVIVTNPNNPTGRTMGSPARQALVEAAERSGAWLISDEVYRGAELDGELTDTFWGEYPRLVVTGGLSKAFGLPGLRIGWAVSDAATIDQIVQRHDYTVIGASPLCDRLALFALTERERVLRRSREILVENYRILEDWLDRSEDVLEWRDPDAGAICTVRYQGGPDDRTLVDQIRREASILLVPGSQFDVAGRHFRVGFGGGKQELTDALDRLTPLLRKLISS